MFGSGLILCATAFQQQVTGYCLLVITFGLMTGLHEVQYGTLVFHLYDRQERPRLLSHRMVAVGLASALLAIVFGRVCHQLSYGSAFLIAGAMMMAGAATFASIRTDVDHVMETFAPWHIVKVALGDRRFRRVAVILTVYGWVGAGSGPVLVLLYSSLGLAEHQVGILTAVRLGGMLVGLTVVTPYLRFAGGISNFRLCFVASAVALGLYGSASVLGTGGGSLAVLSCGELVFGLSLAGFTLAMQTTGISLAPAGKTTVYVNALMVILGLRGIIMPLLTAEVLARWGLEVALISSLTVACGCALVVLVPGIDGRQTRA